MFGPHGVPGGAAPSKLEAETTQEQYNVAGGILNNTIQYYLSFDM